MKIIITESQLQELTGQYKEEVEILYKDNNMVCMVPKSQMTSDIYGKGANWCQRSVGGFGDWSKRGLLIRFLFKDKRKIRFTYFFKGVTDSTEYYWANESGFHVLEGKGNPFRAKTNRKRSSSIEDDILEKMKDIPEQCRENVLKFIKKHKETYEYCYRDNKYVPSAQSEKIEKLTKIKNYYNEIMDSISDKNNGTFIGSIRFIDLEKIKIKFTHYNGDRYVDEVYTEPSRLKARMDEFIEEMEQKYSRKFSNKKTPM